MSSDSDTWNERSSHIGIFIVCTTEYYRTLVIYWYQVYVIDLLFLC